MNNKNDRKDFVSQTYFKLIYYSELHSSNYEDRIEIYNKILSENTELTPEEKRSCQDRAQRNTEREKELFKRGKPIGCGYCKLTRYSTRYCENCIIKYLKSFFGTWTSGCDVIDKFIRECQSNSGLPLHIMEWIPFEQFEDIEHLANGGFATIYTATWKRGSILDFNESKRNFVYQGSQKVVLKSLNNSNEHTEKFFEEAKRFIQIRSGDIVNAYGITKIKTSDNSNYAIVMNYFADGNLRDYLKKNHSTLSLQDRKLGIEYERKKKRTNEKLVIEDEKKKKRTTVAFDNWQQDSFQSQIIKFDFNDSELKKLSDISVIKSKNLVIHDIPEFNN
ncbi:12025_t:CDS:2 [Gigaspora rosea]|nr:12025_t:CDS:2 [Gigaspora rosea]